MSEAVLFEEIVCAGGMRVGVATLNAEKALNALSLQMVDLLAPKMAAWASDPGIALVMLQGAGEKAFSAGGDLQSLYRAMRAHEASARRGDLLGNPDAADFFGREYRLDYRIHTYPKPVLCWGHGIVMGGGVGLMSGASHRVVTEKSRIAMPEISVGLYPDVGGSWLLARVPRRLGLFLALTGAPLNASDAIYTGFADHYVPHGEKPQLLQALQETHWSGARADNDRLLADVLRRCGGGQQPVRGPLQENVETVADICGRGDFDAIVAAILALEGDTNDWLRNAAATLKAGSPGTARLAYTAQLRARPLSLAEVFRMEYVISLHCAVHGDFAEGIRALLIDKDRKPRWNPATFEQAGAVWVQKFFQAPWPPEHNPLNGLEHDLPGA